MLIYLNNNLVLTYKATTTTEIGLKIKEAQQSQSPPLLHFLCIGILNSKTLAKSKRANDPEEMAPPNCLLAVLALTVFLGTSNGLPITSRPIEGNVQRMVWEDWVNLDPEQRNLTKEKKVTAKSIFTLPFRHCPQGHTLYNELCIPQSNIDATDLVKQELILAGVTNGNPPPPPIADYDYGDDVESEEILYDLSVIPTAIQDSPPPSAGSEDQALPSEDAPLKFNIFQKKFPTGSGEPEVQALPQDMVGASNAGNSSTTATSTTTAGTSASNTTTPATPPYKPNGDLQAAPSNTLSTSTTLTMPSSNRDISQVEAIVLPAGQAQAGFVQLVTSPLTDSDSEDSSTTESDLNEEENLDQLLMVDAFLPAYDGSTELLPSLFSHRKLAPPLSTDQDVKAKQADEAAEGAYEAGTQQDKEEVKEGETTTDMWPTEDEEYTTETGITTGDTTIAEASFDDTSSATSTSAFASSFTSDQTSPHPPEELEIDEHENRLVLIKTKVQPVQLTTPTSATSTATATATTAVDDADSSTDRFHYQRFADDVSARSTTAKPEPSTRTPGSSEPIEEDYMPSSDNDNLMTNTIGGHEDDRDEGSHKATSKIDVQQELRLINELVKDKRRKQQKQQQVQLDSTSTEGTSTSTSTEVTITNWSKDMPQLGKSIREASTTTETAATSSQSQANESSSTGNTAASTSQHLSITNRSNRNSKIFKEGQLAKEPAAAAATAATPPNSSSNPDGYTPFWWLPSIGWRLDRKADAAGQDQSLLLRLFSTFRGSGTVPTTR
ncbi:protein folded gastrulation isoform X2 [Drosophila eugracilis]|uniref:protein folded gastrulation isoform X2 n=1 Tax=Drosophila eugracilis TaxID=29029 RepID=UPI0007E666DA|nr:protein folded gastrulation isoform X2 [Drosophila eugracilis]